MGMIGPRGERRRRLAKETPLDLSLGQPWAWEYSPGLCLPGLMGWEQSLQNL
jgi:hypothetical protein